LFAPRKNTDPRWQIVEGPGEVLVGEPNEKGFAEVFCRFPESFWAISWRQEEADFALLANRKHADGAMLVVRPDGAIEVHVMECKETVSASDWRKVLLQFEGSVIRLLAIVGALGERVERVVLYTAFRTDGLSLEASPDAVLLELPLGGDESTSARTDRSWMLSDIHLCGWSSTFPHVKVQKDPEGRARIDLQVAR
jgi:hypothetical protein